MCVAIWRHVQWTLSRPGQIPAADGLECLGGLPTAAPGVHANKSLEQLSTVVGGGQAAIVGSEVNRKSDPR